MATDKQEKDPLERLALPFLIALGFVWALAFALLILDLRAGGWRTIDETALVLLAFLLGIALLPFVSQVSIAGIFQFRRELGQLAGEIQGLKNQVASIATAKAVAEQTTSAAQTQQLFISGAMLSELGARAGEDQAEKVASALTSVTEGKSAQEEWKARWWSFRVLLGLYYVFRRAEQQGLPALAEFKEDSIDTQFTRGVNLFLQEEPEKERQRLQDLIQTNQLIGKGDHIESHHMIQRVLDISHTSGYLSGRIGYSLAVGVSAYTALMRDPNSGPSFLSQLAHELDREQRDSKREENNL